MGCTSVFELSFHIERLASSALLMLEADAREGRPGAAALLSAHAGTAGDAGWLRPRVLASLRAAVAAFRGQLGAVASGCSSIPAAAAAAVTASNIQRQEEELKLTVLVTWDNQHVDVWTHVSPLPRRPQPPVKVSVAGHPRSNAAAKDSEWVRQRKELELGKAADVNEARREHCTCLSLLFARRSVPHVNGACDACSTDLTPYHPHRCCCPQRTGQSLKACHPTSLRLWTEQCIQRVKACWRVSSVSRRVAGFFIEWPEEKTQPLVLHPVMLLTVSIPPTDPRPAGSVRHLILEVAVAENVPVVLQPPRLADLGRWEGAFISSTSRLLLPVDEVLLPTEGEGGGAGPCVAHSFARGGLVCRLEELVLHAVRNASEPLL